MTIDINNDIELLSTKKAADYLGISGGTLNNWRCDKSVALPYVKLGRSVRYRKSSLDAFIQQQETM